MLRIQRFFRINPIIWLILFFTTLASIGLLTVRDYGAPFDEYAEMAILGANLKEYALRMDAKPDTNEYASLGFVRISDNIERDHGICAYYPLAAFYPTLITDSRLYSLVWSIFTWLWFMLGCVSLYGILRALEISRPIAAVGVLLLYLSPRFFAEGHYNNKDVVLLCLVLFTLWMGARLLQKPCFLRGILFSLAGALATNTKIVGAVAWGLIGLTMILLLSFNHRWSKRLVCVALMTITSYVFFYLLLTPAAWDNPIAFFQYLISNASNFSRFGGNVVFRGAQFYDVGGKTPLPWYYLPYYMLVTIPLYALALMVIGQISALRSLTTRFSESIRQKKALLLMAVTLSWVIPLGYAMLTTPLLYNGWRHFYFVYASMVILGGYGLHTLWQTVKTRKVLRVLTTSAMGICLCITSIGLVLNHPFQYAFFNPLQPRDVRMDLDYWNVSDSGAFLKLYELKKDQLGLLKVGCYFNDISVGALKLPNEIYNRLKITVNTDEEFLYYNTTYAYIYSAKEPPDGYHVLFENKSYGYTIGVMYERN